MAPAWATAPFRVGCPPQADAGGASTSKQDALSREGRPGAAPESAHKILRQSSAWTRETIPWVPRDGNEIAMMDSMPSVHPAAIDLPVGMRYSAPSTSVSARVALNHAPETQVAAMPAPANETVRAPIGRRTAKALLGRTAAICRAGYAITRKNLAQDSLAIFAPAFDDAGRPIATVNLSTL